jgi:hypothetical protein
MIAFLTPAGCTTTPMPKQQFKTKTTGAIGNVSTRFFKKANALPPFFPGFRGDWREGESQSSPGSHFHQHPIHVTSDKMWRRPDRVTPRVEYGEKKHKQEISLTIFIICPIPDLWPAGTQACNNHRRRSLRDLSLYRNPSCKSLSAWPLLR